MTALIETLFVSWFSYFRVFVVQCLCSIRANEEFIELN